jgi:hypothetical protein
MATTLVRGPGYRSRMPARFVKGDLFAADLPALAHGCNCAGAMGKKSSRR